MTARRTGLVTLLRSRKAGRKRYRSFVFGAAPPVLQGLRNPVASVFRIPLRNGALGWGLVKPPTGLGGRDGEHPVHRVNQILCSAVSSHRCRVAPTGRVRPTETSPVWETWGRAVSYSYVIAPATGRCRSPHYFLVT